MLDIGAQFLLGILFYLFLQFLLGISAYFCICGCVHVVSICPAFVTLSLAAFDLCVLPTRSHCNGIFLFYYFVAVVVGGLDARVIVLLWLCVFSCPLRQRWTQPQRFFAQCVNKVNPLFIYIYILFNKT